MSKYDGHTPRETYYSHGQIKDAETGKPVADLRYATPNEAYKRLIADAPALLAQRDEAMEEIESLREQLEVVEARRGGECAGCGGWVCPPLRCHACLHKGGDYSIGLEALLNEAVALLREYHNDGPRLDLHERMMAFLSRIDKESGDG